MLGIICLKNKNSYLKKMFKLNSISITNVDTKTKAIYLCFNNIQKKEKEKKFVTKIVNKLKKNNITEILLQNDIYTISDELIKKIKENDIYILTGNKIYEKNLNNIIKYILDNNEKLKIEQISLGIVIDKITYSRMQYIKQMASSVKCMTIVTQDKLKFENTCKDIFENEGLSIKLSDNFKNGLKGCTIIINFDVINNQIIEYLPNNCIYINFSDCIEKVKKNFKGIVINDIKVKIDKEDNNLIKYIDSNKFRNLAVAEAFLEEKENIIIHLVGIKGNIPIDDIKKIDIVKRNKENKGKRNKK